MDVTRADAPGLCRMVFTPNSCSKIEYCHLVGAHRLPRAKLRGVGQSNADCFHDATETQFQDLRLTSMSYRQRSRSDPLRPRPDDSCLTTPNFPSTRLADEVLRRHYRCKKYLDGGREKALGKGSASPCCALKRVHEVLLLAHKCDPVSGYSKD